jgi:hypothetical protein
MKLSFENAHVSCQIDIAEDDAGNARTVMVQGRVVQPDLYERIEVVAANPPEHRMSYSGSALPFPCADIAFCNTPNHAIVTGGAIRATFEYPNSYYTPDAFTKVAPSVFVILRPAAGAGDPVFVRLELPDAYALRTLNHRQQRSGPEFYSRKADILGVQSQEAILRSIGRVKEEHGVA